MTFLDFIHQHIVFSFLVIWLVVATLGSVFKKQYRKDEDNE